MVAQVRQGGPVAPSYGPQGTPVRRQGVHTPDGVDLAAVRTRGPILPGVDFSSLPPHLAGEEATRQLDSVLEDGGSPQLRATREAMRSQTIVYAAMHPEAVQRFLDEQGLDLDPASAAAIEAYTNAVCGHYDAVTLEALRLLQESGVPHRPQSEVIVDGIDIVDIQLGPDAHLPSIEEIAAGDPTQLMNDLLRGNPGSAELTRRRQELAARDDGGEALARFDARILTGLATTHRAAGEDPVHAQSIGLAPVNDSERLSAIPRGFGSVLGILAYLLGKAADKLSDDVVEKARSLVGSTDQSAQYELKALVGRLEQLSGMASSLLQGVAEVLKEASRVR